MCQLSNEWYLISVENFYKALETTLLLQFSVFVEDCFMSGMVGKCVYGFDDGMFR